MDKIIESRVPERLKFKILFIKGPTDKANISATRYALASNNQITRHE